MNKELARQKNLIIGDDDTRYKSIVNKYRLSVELLVRSIVDTPNIDKTIETSNLYIGPSTIASRRYNNTLLGSKYIYVDNNYYVEKLSNEDIEVLLNKPSVDNEVIDLVKRTLREVITYGNSPKIAYGKPYPREVIDNSSLIVIICYGKNKDNNENFRELLKKQNDLAIKIGDKIKEQILDNLNVNTEIILEKLL